MAPVRRRPLGCVHDQHLERRPLRFELEPELLLQRGEERRSIRVDHRGRNGSGRRRLVRRELQVPRMDSWQSGLFDHQPLDLAGQQLGRLRERGIAARDGAGPGGGYSALRTGARPRPQQRGAIHGGQL